jgi:hypothetical protein
MGAGAGEEGGAEYGADLGGAGLLEGVGPCREGNHSGIYAPILQV